MADEIGDLQVNITGDFSELQTAIDNAASAASTGADAIASSLQSIGEASGLVGRDLENFQQLLQEEAAAGISLQQSLEDLAGSAKTVGDEIAGGAAAALESLQAAAQGAGDAAGAATGPIGELGTTTVAAGEAAHEGASSFVEFGESLAEMAGIVVSVEALKEFAGEALTTYANVEKATIALTALTGSAAQATDAIESLKSLALTDALSFPSLLTAYQRMTAFGFEAGTIPGVLQAAADASAATGRGFDQVTAALSRMALSGTASARQMAQLGLSLNDLGAALGVASDQAAAAFKALDPSDRLTVIETALQKYQGVAQAVAEGVAGQWQNLKTQTEYVFESIGLAIAPAAEALMAFGSKVVLPVAQSTANSLATASGAFVQFETSAVRAIEAVVAGAANLVGFNASADQVGSTVQKVTGYFPGWINVVSWAESALNQASLAMQVMTHQQPELQGMLDVTAVKLKGLATAAVMGGAMFDTAWNFSLIAAGIYNVDSASVTLLASQQKLRTEIDNDQASVSNYTAQLSKNQDATVNGIPVRDLLAAATVRLDNAHKALATSLGESTKAVKDAKDSWDALVTTEAKNNDALTQATDTWDALSSAMNAGKDTINGMAVNLKTLEDAANNVAAAFFKATGMVQQWDANAVTVAAGIQGIDNELTKLQNSVSKTSTVFNTLQQAYKDSVAAGTATEAQLQALTVAYNDNQKAIGALQKATEPVAGELSDVTGIVTTLNTVMVNGEAVTVGAGKAFADLSTVIDGSKDALTPFVGTVADGTQKIGALVITANASAVALGNEGQAAGNAVAPIAANTAAKNDNTKAAQVLAQHLKDLNDAWAQGDIVVQSYDSDVVHVVGSANEAANAQENLTQKLLAEADASSNLGEVSNETADALLAEAKAADDAAQAIDNLNNASSKSSTGGKGGSSGSFAAYLEDAIGIAQNPATGGALGGGGTTQGYVDQMAQELADATNSVVTTLDGIFVPAVQRAATIATAQANITAAQTAATAANTTSTTANTSATTANTTATTGATATLTAAQNSFLAAAASGDDVVTSFADLPTAIQDYLDGMNGTLVAYDDTTGALQYTVAGLSGLTSTVNAAVAPHELNTAAVVAATTATTALATATTAAAAGAASLGDATATAAAATAISATATTAAAAAVTALTTTFGAITNALAPSAASINPSAAGAANLGLLGGYGPSSFGYEQTTPGENQYPSTSGGVNLTVHVTGNSVTSQALVDQLATKVGSQLITVLRTTAGFKL